MNPDIKRAWVEALRSGEYGQCTEYLSAQDGFCCLGVLCHLAMKDGVIESPSLVNGADPHLVFDGESKTLPESVAKWAGLWNGGIIAGDFSNDPNVKYRDRQTQLSALNDGLGLTFPQIADLIESQL